MRDHRISEFWSDGPDVFHLQRPGWMSRAACRSEGSDVFFHERYRHAVKVAKLMCSVCPVRRPCLEFAIRGEEVGIWGGMTTSERRVYARHHGPSQQAEGFGG